MSNYIGIGFFKDKLLGIIPAAFLLNLESGVKTKIVKRLDDNDLKTEFVINYPLAKEIIQICESLNHDFLLKKIYKKSKKISLEAYLLTVDNPTKKYLNDFVDRKKNELLELIRAHQIQMFLRTERIEYITDSETVIISKEKAVVKFDFEKKTETLHYRLKLYFQNKPIDLQKDNVYIITNKNAAIIYDNQLIFFDNPSFNGNKLKPFFKKSEIVVKESLQKVFFESFIIPVVKKYEFNVTGFEIKKIKVTPIPKIIVERTFTHQIIITPKFVYNEKIIEYYKSQKQFIDVVNMDGVYSLKSIDRDFEKEHAFLMELKKMGFAKEDKYYYNPEIKDNKYIFISHLAKIAPVFKQLGCIIENTLFNNKIFYSEANISYKTKEKLDWFDLYILITIGDYTLQFIEFREHIINHIQEFVLPDNTIFIIPDSWFAELYSLAIKTDKGNKTKVLKTQLNIVKSKELPPVDTQLSKFMDKMEFKHSIELPTKSIATLRYYQKIGFQWLYQLTQNGFGLCLADDMGLGKTLQIITMLQKYFENKTYPTKALNQHPQQLTLFDVEIEAEESFKTALVVLPKTLIFNWIEELNKFAPELGFWVYHGPNRAQKLKEEFSKNHIILTTYGVVTQDIEALQELNFGYLIADESQAIKNPNSKIFKAITTLNSDYKVSITGTPIENSIRDLWSQMRFLNGDILGNRSYFEKHYFQTASTEMEEHKIAELTKITAPFILRRLKSEVAKEFPERSEQIIYCDMAEVQKEIYDKEKSAIRNELLFSDNEKTNLIGALAILNRLRQLAIHPALTDSNYDDTSGKFKAIIQTIENLIAQGHKFLVFSSFVKHLNLIKDYFEENHISYSMLTGKDNKRQKIVEEFQTNPTIKPFLISIKAGGVGLNLTAANYVLIIDPWWNPYVEQQAIDRTHRIGQTKNVMVYKFITKDSIEEKMLILQNQKLKLTDNLIEKPKKKINFEDIRGLLE